jgi:hypothetical protein
MLELTKSELMSRLKDMDIEAHLFFSNSSRYQVIIVGSSGFILSGLTTRRTADIDSIYVSKELHTMLEKYDFNTRAETYLNCIPHNFEDRLVLFYEGRKINYYILSLEDAVIAKLGAARPEDLEDIMSKEVVDKIDWKQLEHLATDSGELKAASLNETKYKDFLYDYNEFTRRFRPCES